MSGIVSLTSENVKRLHAVHIEPDGSTVIISGANGAGKTSVLDSIEMALGGKGSVPPEPIHNGEDAARIVVELEDMRVTRKFKRKGDEIKTTLEVTSPDGKSKFTSPQKLLDDLVGRLSFDPLSFASMDAAKQRVTLMELLGVDFTGIDRKREEHTTARRDIGRDRDKAQALAGEEPLVKIEQVDVNGIMAELAQVADVIEANRLTRVAFQEAEKEKARVEALVVEARRTLQVTEEGFQDAMAELAQAETAAKALSPDPDRMQIQEKLREAEVSNDQWREQETRRTHAEEAKKLTGVYDDYTAAIQKLDLDKHRALQEAEMPIEGLGISDGGVTLNGLPLEQASGAEALRVSLAMGLALNPELPVILIRDGSLMDAKSMQLVAEMAEAHHAQVWIERVEDSSAAAIVIEDGSVANG